MTKWGKEEGGIRKRDAGDKFWSTKEVGEREGRGPQRTAREGGS